MGVMCEVFWVVFGFGFLVCYCDMEWEVGEWVVGVGLVGYDVDWNVVV